MDTVKFESKQVKVIAHRGLSGIERENTYPAFVAAGNRSYFGMETDVRVTSDGKFILMHDETTERISLGEHNVNIVGNTYSAVEDIVLPDLDGITNRKDIRIPFLIDYVNICKKYGKVCVIELKDPFPEEDIKRMIKEIETADYLKNVIFISFSFEHCVILRKLAPNNDVQWLTSWDINDEVIEKLLENKLNLDINYKHLTKEKIDILHSRGIKVNCWTCDDPETAEKLADYGVDFITSNILE